MEIGKLKHQIVIQQNTPTRGTSGSFIDSWSTYLTVRAELINTAGSEVFNAGQKDTAVTLRVFKIRYQAGINTSMRVQYDSEYYDIEDVDNIKGLNREIIMKCIKRV